MSRPSAAERLLAPLERFGIRPGLEAIRTLLGELGEPQRRFATVLVAGTNGKGSTCCMLAAIAAAAGYRVGLYTSPHLERVIERVRVGGHAIVDRELAAEIERVLAVARGAGLDRLTYFEALTAAALARFAAHRVELAILEVGLGGRFDATNAVDPVLSVVCPISLDHERHLGRTPGEIAAEKAGVARRGRVVVCWEVDGGVLEVLENRVRSAGGELRIAPREVELRAEEGEDDRVWLQTPAARYRLRPSLKGDHQLANLGLAVRAAELLADRGWPRLASPASVAAVERCRWPGRLERVALGGGRAALLDAAHNPAGAAALAAYLRHRGEPYRLLFGALREKRAERMLPALAVAAEEVVVTSLAGGRGWAPEELAALVDEPVPHAEAGAERALATALAGDFGLLVVCGSIYLLGEVRPLLRSRFGVPPPASDPLW